MKRSSRRNRAFSRLELLVLGGMGALCALWLWPVAAQVNNSQEADDKMAACQSHLKQVGLAMRQYTQDYDELYPPAAICKSPYGWADALTPYLQNDALYQCPSERHTEISSATQPGFTDYWYNRNLANQSESTVNDESRTIMFGDGDGGSPASNARYSLAALPRAWLTTPRSPARRHRNMGDYCFADGHVKILSPQGISFTSHYYTFSLH